MSVARPLLAGVLLCAGAAAQDFSNLRVEKAALGFSYTEGPAWSREGFLLFTDVPSGRILKLAPGQEKPEVFRPDAHATYGLAYDSRGRLYACEAGARRVTRTDKNGRIEVLAERWEGKRLNAPNDIVVRHDGHAWFTDPAFGRQQDTRELDYYGIYHLAPKGELSLVARWKTRPNGIALSPDGRTLYVSDSDQHGIHAWTVDREGQASGERTFVTGIDGVPGGIKTDEKGNLYVAARGLSVYSAAGQRLLDIPLAAQASNLAFGDADDRTLYITARAEVLRVRLDVKGAQP